ncbi:MAG: archease [Nanoarchaeota archaeon]
MFKITQFDHTADIGFNIEASSLSELFKASAIATFDTMVDIKKIKPKIKKTIKLKNKELDKLFFDFIEELIFLKDSKYMLFSKFNIKIKQNNKEYNLESNIFGEKINPKKQPLKIDVKAITFHEFYVKKEKNWKAKFVLDI